MLSPWARQELQKLKKDWLFYLILIGWLTSFWVLALGGHIVSLALFVATSCVLTGVLVYNQTKIRNFWDRLRG
jgi:hypothetical protein